MKYCSEKKGGTNRWSIVVRRKEEPTFLAFFICLSFGICLFSLCELFPWSAELSSVCSNFLFDPLFPWSTELFPSSNFDSFCSFSKPSCLISELLMLPWKISLNVGGSARHLVPWKQRRFSSKFPHDHRIQGSNYDKIKPNRLFKEIAESHQNPMFAVI